VIRLDLDAARATVGKALTFDLSFPCCLLLVDLDTARSVPRTPKDLICRVEGAPALNLGWPQFNRLSCLLVVKPGLEGFFGVPFQIEAVLPVVCYAP